MNKKKKEKMRSASSFSVEERDAIIKEYLRGSETKTKVWRRHTGQKYERVQLMGWMRQLGYLSPKPSNKRGLKGTSLRVHSF